MLIWWILIWKHTLYKKCDIRGKGLPSACPSQFSILAQQLDINSTGESFTIKPASHLQVQHLPDLKEFFFWLQVGALVIYCFCHLAESYVDASKLADVFTICESLYVLIKQNPPNLLSNGWLCLVEFLRPCRRSPPTWPPLDPARKPPPCLQTWARPSHQKTWARWVL